MATDGHGTAKTGSFAGLTVKGGPHLTPQSEESRKILEYFGIGQMYKWVESVDIIISFEVVALISYWQEHHEVSTKTKRFLEPINGEKHAINQEICNFLGIGDHQKITRIRLSMKCGEIPTLKVEYNPSIRYEQIPDQPHFEARYHAKSP